MKEDLENCSLEDEVYDLNRLKRDRINTVSKNKTADLPDSQVYIVFAIIAVLTGIFFIGIIIGAIVIKKCNDSIDFYNLTPEKYSTQSYNNTLNARILGFSAIGLPLVLFPLYSMISGASPLNFFKDLF